LRPTKGKECIEKSILLVAEKKLSTTKMEFTTKNLSNEKAGIHRIKNLSNEKDGIHRKLWPPSENAFFPSVWMLLLLLLLLLLF
jgi:hypothetical protein